MKYIFVSLLLLGCSSLCPGGSFGPSNTSGITVTPASTCSQLSGEERRECLLQYEQNPSDYDSVMSE